MDPTGMYVEDSKDPLVEKDGGALNPVHIIASSSGTNLSALGYSKADFSIRAQIIRDGEPIATALISAENKGLYRPLIDALEKLNVNIADATLTFFNDLLYSGNTYIGEDAYYWDFNFITYEQGVVAAPIYNNMSRKSLNIFNDLVRGKDSNTIGWYKFLGRFNNVNFGKYGKNVWDKNARIDIPMHMLYGDKHTVR